MLGDYMLGGLYGKGTTDYMVRVLQSEIRGLRTVIVRWQG